MTEYNKDEEDNVGYVSPKHASLQELIQKDADDPSLREYKAKLIGEGAEKAILFPDDPRCVIPKSLSLIFRDHEPIELDMKDTDHNKVYKIKEDVEYQVRIEYYVQRDIVIG
uniref:Rho GDP-dissociation inhibitor 1 n=1 Tax=Lygus hesperus TaxID=30085 RepID=A0A0A9XG92_LYGHE